MGKLLNIVTPLHKATKRDYVGRMVNNKVEAMKRARQYGYDYWDGDRAYGYGGYKYDGRWKVVAEKFIDIYGLDNGSSVLDLGCGKGFLLYELKNILPGIRICGLDISEYVIENAKDEVKKCLRIFDIANKLPYENDEFDLVYSITTLHNLKIYDLKMALSEMERIGKEKYLLVEAYRNEEELFNLQCWALTCEEFMRPDEWVWVFKEFGYSGDYEFIYFE